MSKVLTGTDQKPLRWKRCVQESSRLHYAIDALYVERYFNRLDKFETWEMARKLQRSLIDIIHNVDWMDNVTKHHALEKVDFVFCAQYKF